MMIKNYYFLIVGILSILFSFTHGWFGQTTVLSLIDASNLDLTTKTAIFYTWHISTAENFMIGIAFFIMAYYKDIAPVKFAVWFIVSLVVVRYAVFFISTLFKNISGVKDAIPELVILSIYVSLMILGLKYKATNKRI